ncbi:hypothetical protein EVAR_73595_1 [Eumeta japonica]|uniref:Uncharacterized protein n=1 Tax=Eumeta variegata TaxID=151549 RepID=A0A4C1SDB7_EUMVA|nr:hypothetical protein EVAR_73595_1 [Eumeta japonica]
MLSYNENHFLQQNVSGRPLVLMDKNSTDSSVALCTREVDTAHRLILKDTIPDKSQLTCHPTPAQDAIEKISLVESELNTIGRPRLEEAQPELLKVLAVIASFGGGADEERRTEMVRSCRTLDDLVKELEALATVPVKLARATNDGHKSHPDGKFCTASIRAIESLASMLGPAQVFFLSQDDKARIPIVYAGIEINADGMGRPEAVTYSGPTYVAIRSGKHSSSSARTHSIDLEHLMELTEFQSLAKTDYNSIKPVINMTVDGGPDENPRFPQVIFHAISTFQRTIDNELELKNFKMAGNILAQIWSKLIIDDKPVVAEYVDPASDNIDKSLVEWTPDWYCRHISAAGFPSRFSRYTTLSHLLATVSHDVNKQVTRLKAILHCDSSTLEKLPSPTVISSSSDAASPLPRNLIDSLSYFYVDFLVLDLI